MRSRVYFINSEDNMSDMDLGVKLTDLISREQLLDFIEPEDITAIKTHFGEEGSKGYIRPEILAETGKLVKKLRSRAFLTETSTLYRHSRANAIDHIELAYKHGFTYEKTGMPIIMSDGLLGNEETRVPIEGRLYKEVGVASAVPRVQNLITFSHFTGHILAGFGAAMKNLGMGLTGRRGKMVQHSTSKPSIKVSKCSKCGECIKWCPEDAIYEDYEIKIKRKKCIGCGECLTACRFDAIGYNWSESFDILQQKIVEHAMGVVDSVGRGRVLFINVLTRITKNCDCMEGYEQIVPDIGILVSKDPVAIDSASIDLVEEALGSDLSEAAHNVPYRTQVEYGHELGFGSKEYELHTV